MNRDIPNQNTEKKYWKNDMPILSLGLFYIDLFCWCVISINIWNWCPWTWYFSKCLSFKSLISYFCHIHSKTEICRRSKMFLISHNRFLNWMCFVLDVNAMSLKVMLWQIDQTNALKLNLFNLHVTCITFTKISFFYSAENTSNLMEWCFLAAKWIWQLNMIFKWN